MHSSSALRGLAGWLGLSALIIVLDQVSKAMILASIELGRQVEVLPPVFSLVLTYNRGAAFSFLATEAGWQRYFFILIAIGASALIIYMMTRHKADRFLCFALALVLGGAIGNLIDRVLHGAVVDFLLFRWPGGPALFNPWPAFNLADSCISVGAVLLIFDSFSRSRKASEN
ncbi:MAG TPA: signal peptidase II [Burkholderiales bacterium]|nr:signal peptidase II [Burkholderiales bacterium]